jgi:hypothetical protein
LKTTKEKRKKGFFNFKWALLTGAVVQKAQLIGMLVLLEQL